MPRRGAPEPRRLEVVQERPQVLSPFAALLMVVLVVVVLFGVVAFHTLLVGNQSQLDELDRRLAAEQAELEQLILREAQLSAPDRIVSVASEDLGMVTPLEVVWLDPTEAGSGRP
jgi:cell division protein FtsL